MATKNGTPSSQPSWVDDEYQERKQKLDSMMEEMKTDLRDIDANRQFWTDGELQERLLRHKSMRYNFYVEHYEKYDHLKQRMQPRVRQSMSEEFRRMCQEIETELRNCHANVLNSDEDPNNNPYGPCTPAQIQLFKEIVEVEAREMLQHPQTQENIARFTHYVVGCRASFWKLRIKQKNPNMSKERLDKLATTFCSRKDQPQVIYDICKILESVGISARLVQLYKILAEYLAIGKAHSVTWKEATPSQIALLAPLHRKEYDGYTSG